MSQTFIEFSDQNMHRVYPLEDDSSGEDTTGTFTIPTDLMTDMFLCAPNIAGLDKTFFYIRNITIRRHFIDIAMGYSGLAEDIGVFRNIDPSADRHTSYDFVPSKLQTVGPLAPLYCSTGQVTIGDASTTAALAGSWSFDYANSHISSARISQGLRNVQYISVNNRLFTGEVKLKEGANVTLDVDTQDVGGTDVTTITINASLPADATVLDLQDDTDVLNALIAQYGIPILTVNGLNPDGSRNFTITGGDCTVVENNTNGVTISNPCASPCGDEDTQADQLLDSISNLDLRYARLNSNLSETGKEVNDLALKVAGLGAADV